MLLLSVILLLLFAVTGVFLGLLEVEKPEIYRIIADKAQRHNKITDPIRIGLVYIITLEFERWELAGKCRWVARLLFVLNVSYLMFIAYELATLGY